MRALVPADVPIHRATVGADPTNMGNRQPDRFHDGFKPYVYRGTGVDTLTPHIGEDWERGKGAPEPESITRKRTKSRKRKSRKQSQWLRDKIARREEALAASFRARERARAQSYRAQLTASDERMLAERGYEPEPEEQYRLGDPRHPDHERYYGNRKPARPAPGWQPTTGADIDALLDALSD